VNEFEEDILIVEVTPIVKDIYDRVMTKLPE
jgi:hypothetical protein